MLCIFFFIPSSCTSSLLPVLPAVLPYLSPLAHSPSTFPFLAFPWWRVTNSLFRCPPPPQRWTGLGHHGPRGQLVALTVATTARGRAPPRRHSTGVVTAPAMTSLRPTAPAACVGVSMATIRFVWRAAPLSLSTTTIRPQEC